MKILSKLYEYNVISGGSNYDQYNKKLVNLGNFIWNGNYYKAGLKQQSNSDEVRNAVHNLAQMHYTIDGNGSTDANSSTYNTGTKKQAVQVKVVPAGTEGSHPIVDSDFADIAKRVLPALVSPSAVNGVDVELSTATGIVAALGFFDPAEKAPKQIPVNKKDRNTHTVGSTDLNITR